MSPFVYDSGAELGVREGMLGLREIKNINIKQDELSD